MTEAEKIILAARQLAAESELEGTTAYDNFLIGALETEIRHLCKEKERIFRMLEEKINKLAA